jgi:plastocyanin
MRSVKAIGLLLVFAVLGVALPAGAATYNGVADAPSVAWISGSVPQLAGSSMRQTAKTFIPPLLVVTTGSTVRFPNDDGFYHSVYSDSPSNPFDLGLYNNGPGKSVEFDNAGVVEIRCHVHGSMHATIVVVDGPFATTTEANGRYRIDGVTPGAHVLHVWTPAGGIASANVVVK